MQINSASTTVMKLTEVFRTTRINETVTIADRPLMKNRKQRISKKLTDRSLIQLSLPRKIRARTQCTHALRRYCSQKRAPRTLTQKSHHLNGNWWMTYYGVKQ